MSAKFVQNQLFRKNSFRKTFRVSNSFDPDQAQHFVGPNLGPNCLRRLSADNTGRPSFNVAIKSNVLIIIVKAQVVYSMSFASVQLSLTILQ